MCEVRALDQGSQLTCVAHAFTQALTANMLSKYGIVCSDTAVVEKVKCLCPCFEGHHTQQMPGRWNKKHMKEGAQIEDISRKRRYRVKVECHNIGSFAEAEREMKRAESQNLWLPCTITIAQQGHVRHSVAMTGCIEEGKMDARNSWGAVEVCMTVTRENFVDAITIDPIITLAWEGMEELPPPNPRQAYVAREEAWRKRKEWEDANDKKIEELTKQNEDLTNQNLHLLAKIKDLPKQDPEGGKRKRGPPDLWDKNLILQTQKCCNSKPKASANPLGLQP